MARFHTLTVALICIAMLFVRVMGVHGHVAQEHNDHHVVSELDQLDTHHDHAIAAFVSSYDADHELVHFSHADLALDVDPPQSSIGKLPASALVALVCALLGLWLWSSQPSFSTFSRATPRRMWRRYLLPLAHAPPIAR